MMFPIWPVIDILSLLTIGSQVFITFLLALLVYELLSKRGCTKVHRWIADRSLLLMLIVAVTATGGSLFFSEIAQFPPCRDCWFQRIFMYPQVLILGYALWKRDQHIAPYILILCLVGMVVSMDHYKEQWEAILNPEEYNVMEPCDLSGISCRATYFLEYGYITIPLMALTAFILNALGSLAIIRCGRKQ